MEARPAPRGPLLTPLRKILLAILWRSAGGHFKANCMLLIEEGRFGRSIVIREFVVDLVKRLSGVWNADALVEHGISISIEARSPCHVGRAEEDSALFFYVLTL
eukprot:1160537-Pelagomonas_calceolata.AAC.3